LIICCVDVFIICCVDALIINVVDYTVSNVHTVHWVELVSVDYMLIDHMMCCINHSRPEFVAPPSRQDWAAWTSAEPQFLWFSTVYQL
jgi:hypothetical protein